MTRHRRIRNRWLVLLTIAVILALISPAFRFSLFLEWVSMDRVISLVEQARSNRWLSVAFLGVYSLGVMVLPITLFPIVGGVLFNFWIALPLNILAATMGAWLSFRVGRRFGRSAILPLLRGNLKAIDRLSASEGLKTVFLLRLIGIPPFIVSNYGLGLSAVHDRDFILGTIVGMSPWMALVTYLSTSLWQAVLVGGEKGLMSALVKAMAPLTAISVLVMVGVVVNWLMKRRRERLAATRICNQSPQS